MESRAGKRNSVLNKMHDHFAYIAPQYRQLRTTDLGPILFITDKLRDLPSIHAADIGCGTGRYSLKFVQHLGEKCHLFCLDNNREMLRQLKEHFMKNNIRNFTTIRSDSHKMPIQTDSLDCVMSFNAIHHFSLNDFLRESSRVLKNDGKLFVYTRLRDQNAKTIWGMHFPSFNQKENRLYELDELKSAFEKDKNLNINSIKFFEHHRVYPLEKLVEQVKNHHYSTFKFYKKYEFKEALHKFVQNILNHYDDLDKISWKDQNTLLVIENKQ
ncbi:MAG: class I SAM-dependent methyltransferase [Thaumarchaeota archaeon]|nr:class I SAM-dependent methyltransferase [Nitrososphaerota archaeon]MDE1817013.1 class I SAM-dependent methyltransferase [Nitrososphaerota archaeon]MDE1876242.1 class I SAM-dependent methyltransferase [Nitrososphaerota archaeon]